ncbi:MmpS family transport accessory protein [Mycobacterium terramassiliense]|uniref:Mycobacterium terramassiliense ORFan n=1 Tax=Mycobacterium terramassiliense TaxID=1841859 RepID=A0A2U3NI97_9MYCO|nr:MmpS family transport accessory protein [Mycobacterium terramassiliense]SPM31257.1 Mycobacterium terramassiliense ORFan [Mycobacterium terramassiliense]
MMHQDDLERRIAELERRSADAKAAAGSDPAFPLDASREHGRALAQDETARGDRRAWIFFGLLFVLPIAAVVCLCATTALVTLKPSSALWMSGIVCGSGYHLANDNKHYGTPSGGSGITMSFRCVSGNSSYHANDFSVFELQFLLVGIASCAAVAAGVLLWRLLPKRSTERRPRRPARVAAVAAMVPVLAAIGIGGYLVHRASPTTTEVRSPSPTTTAPVGFEPPRVASTAAPPAAIATATPSGPVQVTYSVTGTKAPGDSITVEYVDASGRLRTEPDIDVPWTLTLALTSPSAVRIVQASSLLGVSKLNCAITTGDGRVVDSSNRNDPRVHCFG